MRFFKALKYIGMSVAGVTMGVILAANAEAASGETSILGVSLERTDPNSLFDCGDLVSTHEAGIQNFQDRCSGVELEDEFEEYLEQAGEETPPEDFMPEKYQRAEQIKSAEDVIKAFGAPETDDPILAQIDAPPAFQGFYHAARLGNEDLMRGYAKRAARMVANMRDANEMFSRYVSREMDKPQLHDISKSVETYVDELGAELPEDVRRKLLELMEKEEEIGSGIDVAELRREYRAQFERAGLRPSKDGRLNISLFVDVNDQQSIEMARLMSAVLFDKSNLKEKDRGVAPNIDYFYVGQPSGKDLRVFANMKVPQASIPRDGNKLFEDYVGPIAEKGAPVAVFVSPGEQRIAHIQHGAQPLLYIDELINFLREEKKDNGDA